MKFANKIFKKIVLIYAVFVTVWFFFNRFMQDAWWGLTVLDKFAEYFLLPACAICLLSAFSRKISTTIFSLVPALISIFFYWSFFVPIKPGVEVQEIDRFRVATYNIWNQNDDIGNVISAINNTYSDVIALQEITEEHRLPLIDGLISTYPHYHISKPVYGGTTALFSRHPLSDIYEHDVQIDRPSIIANVSWYDKQITIVSAHLNPSFWAYWQQPWHKIPGNYQQYIKDQNMQVSSVIETIELRPDTDATILACDCNSQETASTNRLLSGQFNDVLKSVGWQIGDTGSENLRFERKLTHIDYIWYSGAIVPKSIYRGNQTAGSDHEPVIADFVF